MVLDFADAFMSIRLRADEFRLNCAIVPEGLARTRPPIDPDEPTQGAFVVGRGVGFGGRPSPCAFYPGQPLSPRVLLGLSSGQATKEAGGKTRLRLAFSYT